MFQKQIQKCLRKKILYSYWSNIDYFQQYLFTFFSFLINVNSWRRKIVSWIIHKDEDKLIIITCYPVVWMTSVLGVFFSSTTNTNISHATESIIKGNANNWNVFNYKPLICLKLLQKITFSFLIVNFIVCLTKREMENKESF